MFTRFWNEGLLLCNNRTPGFTHVWRGVKPASLSWATMCKSKVKIQTFHLQLFSRDNTKQMRIWKGLFGTCSWYAVPPGVDRVEPVEPVTVVQGSLVTLTCEAHGFPLPTLTWMKDGQPLSLHRNLLLDGQETRLQLPDVARSDEGLYSCVASNQAGSSTKSFNLTVLGRTITALIFSCCKVQ